MISHEKLNKQKGLSLVELLIAMLVGLFLLAGITTTYLSSKKSSVDRSQISILQDNGRIALEIISDIIVHAGYVGFPSGVISPSGFITSPVTSNSCNGSTQNIVNPSIFSGIATEDGLAGTSDTLGVIYLGDDNYATDCGGNVLPTACHAGGGESPESARIYNSFSVDSSSNTLQCRGSLTDTPQIVAENVENIQFLYGIDADGDKVVDRYINATQIGSFLDNVISVQVSVLVRSDKETKKTPESISYSLLDQTVTSPNDRYLRAVFTTTMNLRNTL